MVCSGSVNFKSLEVCHLLKTIGFFIILHVQILMPQMVYLAAQVKAVSLGKESSESTILHIVENNGSEWLNLHNVDDFI